MLSGVSLRLLKRWNGQTECAYNKCMLDPVVVNIFMLCCRLSKILHKVDLDYQQLLNTDQKCYSPSNICAVDVVRMSFYTCSVHYSLQHYNTSFVISLNCSHGLSVGTWTANDTAGHKG